MKLAQVQEKNEVLNTEKQRLEGYLRTAKKASCCLSFLPLLHELTLCRQMIRELRQQKKDEADAEAAVLPLL